MTPNQPDAARALQCWLCMRPLASQATNLQRWYGGEVAVAVIEAVVELIEAIVPGVKDEL